MTLESTVIDGGLGPSLLTPVPFACGSCPNLFRLGAVLVPDVADPGAVAVVGAAFTMRTDGVTVGCIPNTLPQRPSSRPAVEPRSPSVTPTLDTPTLAFDQGFLFLLDGQHRAHLFNRGRVVSLYREVHHHKRDRRRRACVHEWVVCGEASRWQKASWMSATPLIVTRLRLDGGLGVGRESDGGNAATLSTSSRSGKGAPTGVGRC